jgi:hypothetical protein
MDHHFVLGDITAGSHVCNREHPMFYQIVILGKDKGNPHWAPK